MGEFIDMGFLVCVWNFDLIEGIYKTDLNFQIEACN